MAGIIVSATQLGRVAGAVAHEISSPAGRAAFLKAIAPAARAPVAAAIPSRPRIAGRPAPAVVRLSDPAPSVMVVGRHQPRAMRSPSPVIVRSPAAPAPEPRRMSVPAPEPKQQCSLDEAVQVYQNARGLTRTEALRQVMAEHPVYRTTAHAGDFERLVEAEAIARADHNIPSAISTIAGRHRAAYFSWIERGMPQIFIQPSRTFSSYREAVHARARADGVALTVAAYRVARDPQTKHLHAAWREQGYPSIQ